MAKAILAKYSKHWSVRKKMTGVSGKLQMTTHASSSNAEYVTSKL